MALLSIQNIHCGYFEGIDILQNVSLAIDSGSFIGIIGPNGAGKSTLLKTIFGFLKYRQGKICFKNAALNRLSPFEIKKLGISYIPQGSNNFPYMTVRENLVYYAMLYGLSRKRRRRWARPLMI